MTHARPSAALPAARLAAAQSAWLEPARWRLLRRARIAQRGRVLDLAAGHGDVTCELVRRSAGQVIALDRSASLTRAHSAGVWWIFADAHELPLRDGSFDLVFAQFAFLWFADPAQVAREVHRILAPGGVLVAVEPDYGGLMEWPLATALREIWLAALARAGADPWIGRKLPGLLAAAGFQVAVSFLEQLEPPRAERFELLGELPLTAEERQQLQAAASAASTVDSQAVAHLPFWLLLAERPRGIADPSDRKDIPDVNSVEPSEGGTLH